MLSGIRPTQPTLHVGNYLGALRQFVRYQEEFPGNCFFFIADLHSIQDVADGATMRRNSLSVATEFMAAGLDPTKSTLYIQSAIPELTQLTWLLTAFANDTELVNLPHYREKRDKMRSGADDVEGTPSTLLVYPILQSADILYTGDHRQTILVPVGTDQRPHIEFTRDVARRFNKAHGDTIFGSPNLPVDVDMGEADVRIVGLDGKGKMGKSEGNAVYMDSDPETIRSLVKKGVTDPARMRAGDKGTPDNCQGIYPLHVHVTDRQQRETFIQPGCLDGSLNCSECKAFLADGLIELFREFRERKAMLIAHPEIVTAALEEGADRARGMVKAKLRVMHEAMGLAPYKE